MDNDPSSPISDDGEEEPEGEDLGHDDDDDEEEEEDDDVVDPELQNFITDEVVEDGEVESEKEGDDDENVSGRKRSRAIEEDDEDIDDDDYDLIEENLGVKLKKKKKFSRIKLDSDDEQADDDEIPEAKKAIEKVLFQEEASDSDSDIDRAREKKKNKKMERREKERAMVAPGDDDDEESDDESDVNDFIVDDEGVPMSRKKKHKKGAVARQTDENLAEAQELFGADFDLDDLNKVYRSTADDYYDEEDEDYEDGYEEEMDEDDADFIEDEDGQTLRSKMKKAKAEKVKREAVRKLVQFDPSLLERGHYLPEDERIKSIDIPERFQLRQIPVEPFKTEDEPIDEAQWIFAQAFLKEYSSNQTIRRPSHNGGAAYDESNDAAVEGKQAGDFYGFSDNKSPETVTKIRDVLKLIREQMHEVPFIHCYRRELCEQELDEIYDLWTIWQSDEKWMQLQKRKSKLTTLFMDMKNYLENLTRNCEDYSRIAEIRPLEEFDIAQLKVAETMLQVEDVYQHFLLHYGHYIAAMNETKVVQKPPKKQPLEGENDDENESQDADETEAPPVVKLKRPQRKQLYQICIKNKIYNFANLFGMSPENFGVNITDGYQKHTVTTSSQYPSDVALELICDAFANKEAVTNAAIYMVAQQLCHEPSVRKSVRKSFEDKVGINVRPTKKGLREIDELHALYPMKYLKGKPVRSLEGADFVHLIEAEKQGLIQMTFKIPDTLVSTSDPNSFGLEGYIGDLALMYHQDAYSDVVREWNELRKRAVRMSVEKLLFPILESELRDKLLKEAQDFVIREAVCHLHTSINIQPWIPNSVNTQMTDEEGDYDNGARVISIAYSDAPDEPSYAVYLDKHGVPKDYLRLSNIMRTNKKSSLEVKLREQDISSLSDFFQRVRPHTAVVCTSSMKAKMLIISLEDMLQTLETEFSFPSVGLELMNDDLAIVYEKSSKGKKEFPNYPELLRRAVSAGRRLQDPLVEFAQLCDDVNDLLSYKFHTLQNLVPKDDLVEALTTEFVSMTNKVGVDINRCLDYPHYAPLLQFVCGLGPRKASAAIHLLNRKNLKLANRTQLVTEVQMGPKIFVNSAGFVKIDVHSFDADAADDETWLDPLDGTRIHPETYEWARKMAVDALEYDDVEGDEEGAQQKTARAVEEIMEAPDKLKDLDLDAFAEELDRQGYGKKNITLYDINLELSSAFKDRYRRQPQPPSDVERFEMLTKETPETLSIGKLVYVTAVKYVCKYPNEKDVGDLEQAPNGNWKCPFCEDDSFGEIAQVWSHFDSKTCQGKPSGVNVRLETGMHGTITLNYLSDNPPLRPEEKVQIGQTFFARIRTLDVVKFRCTLTSRSSDLIDSYHQFTPTKDENYDHMTETYDKDIAKAERDKRQQTKQYMKRVIVHPNFANVTYEECIKRLNCQDQGDCLFRPSSKGPGYLTCTWKVEEGIFQHILIEEQRQENSFSLGKTLVISNQEYEDLDEVIATYIKPMALMVRELSQYKYYYQPTEDKTAIERELLQQKMTNPSKIPYFLTACVKRPGFFYLVYLPRGTVVWEFVTINPNGFKYRDHVFMTLNQLLAWFKVHFRDPRPDARPQKPPQQPGIGISADYGGVHGAMPSASHTYFDQARRTPMGGYHTSDTGSGSGSHRQSSISPPVMQPVQPRPPGSSSQRIPSADSFRPHSDYNAVNGGYSSRGNSGQMTPSYNKNARNTPRR